MSWLQLTLTLERPQIPAAELLLESLGALSVTFADAKDQPLLEPGPGETPLWQHSRITALFESDADQNRLQKAIREGLPREVADSLHTEVLKDQAWERAWMDDFHAMRFGRRLWICPAGQRPESADAEQVCIDLDPGLAFGTGTHPTTALCLRWLDQADLVATEVLDYGCGSGILALAAAKLGATRVDAVDHDNQALEASRDNAEKNAVSERIAIYAPDQLPDGQYAIVLANILAGALQELAPTLTEKVAPGGHLVLSGILQDQAEQVMQSYLPVFHFSPVQQEQDWVLLHGIRQTG